MLKVFQCETSRVLLTQSICNLIHGTIELSDLMDHPGPRDKAVVKLADDFMSDLEAIITDCERNTVVAKVCQDIIDESSNEMTLSELDEICDE